MSSHLFFSSAEFLLTAGSQERGISYEEGGQSHMCHLVGYLRKDIFRGRELHISTNCIGTWRMGIQRDRGIGVFECLVVLGKRLGAVLFFGPDGGILSSIQLFSRPDIHCLTLISTAIQDFTIGEPGRSPCDIRLDDTTYFRLRGSLFLV